jgi:hypothetical protein
MSQSLNLVSQTENTGMPDFHELPEEQRHEAEIAWMRKNHTIPETTSLDADMDEAIPKKKFAGETEQTESKLKSILVNQNERSTDKNQMSVRKSVTFDQNDPALENLSKKEDCAFSNANQEKISQDNEDEVLAYKTQSPSKTTFKPVSEHQVTPHPNKNLDLMAAEDDLVGEAKEEIYSSARKENNETEIRVTNIKLDTSKKPIETPIENKSVSKKHSRRSSHADIISKENECESPKQDKASNKKGHKGRSTSKKRLANTEVYQETSPLRETRRSSNKKPLNETQNIIEKSETLTSGNKGKSNRKSSKSKDKNELGIIYFFNFNRRRHSFKKSH